MVDGLTNKAVSEYVHRDKHESLKKELAEVKRKNHCQSAQLNDYAGEVDTLQKERDELAVYCNNLVHALVESSDQIQAILDDPDVCNVYKCLADYDDVASYKRVALSLPASSLAAHDAEVVRCASYAVEWTVNEYGDIDVVCPDKTSEDANNAYVKVLDLHDYADSLVGK